MKARVVVTLKNGVLDPQGQAIERALSNLNFDGVQSVRQGRYFEVDLENGDAASAKANVEDMCEKLLANTVIENYSVEVE